jgi:hypothetical protein
MTLKESANGTAATKWCHLCALILRSLKHPRTMGTVMERIIFQAVPLASFCGNYRQDSAFRKIGDYIGYPLTCSAESCRTFPFPSSYALKSSWELDDGYRGQEISLNADSNEIFVLIKRWCEDCFQKREKCPCTSSQDAWLLVRVIDVSPLDGSKEPYLWISQGHAGKYVSLAHRWRP